MYLLTTIPNSQVRSYNQMVVKQEARAKQKAQEEEYALTHQHNVPPCSLACLPRIQTFTDITPPQPITIT